MILDKFDFFIEKTRGTSSSNEVHLLYYNSRLSIFAIIFIIVFFSMKLKISEQPLCHHLLYCV